MEKNKILAVILLLMLFINPIIYATSIEEIDDQLKSLNSGLSQLEGEISSNSVELQEQQDKVNTLNEQISQLEMDVANAETELSNLETEIINLQEQNKQLETEKVKKEKEAEESKAFTKTYLQFLQSSSKEETLLNSIFSKESGAEIIQSIEATKEFTSASQEITNDLFKAIIEIKAKTAQIDENVKNISEKKDDVVKRKTALETQVASLSVTKDAAKKMESKVAAKQGELLEQEADLRMQQRAAEDSKAFLASAGCGPNDVYGVDCGEKLPDGTISGFIRPTSTGVMTCDWMCYDNHKGIDIGGSNNQEIYASAPGIVTGAFSDVNGGNMVTVLHVVDGQNFMTAYMHMNSFNVNVGQQVSTTTVLGYMGSTGMSTGTHLHFAIAPGVSSWDPYAGVDPRTYVNFPPEGEYFGSR